MTTPTANDFDALIAYLAVFEAPGFVAAVEDAGVDQPASNDVVVRPLLYDDQVRSFIKLAASAPWHPAAFDVISAADLLDDKERVSKASLEELRQCLRYVVRGEKFCDGHWEDVISDGRVSSILRRLIELRSTSRR